MGDNNNERFEITEMFMAQADHERCFYGIIKRETDKDGKPFVFSRIKVNDGFICARASEQRELGRKLDKMVLMVLDKGLHNKAGVSIEIIGNDFFLN